MTETTSASLGADAVEHDASDNVVAATTTKLMRGTPLIRPRSVTPALDPIIVRTGDPTHILHLGAGRRVRHLLLRRSRRHHSRRDARPVGLVHRHGRSGVLPHGMHPGFYVDPGDLSDSFRIAVSVAGRALLPDARRHPRVVGRSLL